MTVGERPNKKILSHLEKLDFDIKISLLCLLQFLSDLNAYSVNPFIYGKSYIGFTNLLYLKTVYPHFILVVGFFCLVAAFLASTGRQKYVVAHNCQGRNFPLILFRKLSELGTFLQQYNFDCLQDRASYYLDKTTTIYFLFTSLMCLIK